MRTTSPVRKVVTIIGGTLVAASLIGTAPAIAKSATTTGSHVWTWKDEGHAYQYVKDTAADSRSAAAKYERSASAGTIRTLWAKGGSGTTTKSGKGSKIIKMQACRQEQAAPDTCSKWVAN
ncbi:MULTISPECIES: hypothetical protein [Streptomyces]|uniref:DUF4189 domain-containing protein n=1 Tax=Streptomyces albus TaxID=1888 RepID=A0A8H1QQQ2_9ACTN|nr:MULTISPECIES: hypothetical protein [Streptomyces]TGG78474.1 hypothetical protein D8771_25090 [Streptomyces albus]UVN59444.1 hypothetical protein NR995_33460 [Streptomyces albus]